MKRLSFIIVASFAVCALAVAQPAKSRVAAAVQKTTATTKAATNDRASLQFPTSIPQPEDVVWKRDIYRQLDLTKEKNAPLYYPVEPSGKQMNLFTYLFRLVLTGRVQAYAYKLDMSESFEEKDKLVVKEFLERYSIMYDENNGRLTVDDSDVPSSEVTRYFLKESVFLDQRTGTFSTRVAALCPVMMRSDDMAVSGDDEFAISNDDAPAAMPYPLFWVKYEDVAPWLAKLAMMGSSINNVSNLTADDFFTMNRYEGKIYKTNNLRGRLLADYCKTDSAMIKEQKKIEKQLVDFEEGVWGHLHKVDTTKVETVEVAKKKKTTTTTTSDRSRRRTTSEPSAEKSEGAAAPRVSARRTRR